MSNKKMGQTEIHENALYSIKNQRQRPSAHLNSGSKIPGFNYWRCYFTNSGSSIPADNAIRQ
jgi:hypothetical protein